MKILELNITGMYQFENCNFKFYTNRQSKNIYLEDTNNYGVSKIYPKDINLIIGGNASGKTTLLKSLVIIERILSGERLSLEEVGIFKDDFAISIKYLKNKDANADYIFEYKVSGQRSLISEELSYAEFKRGELITKEITRNKVKSSKYNCLSCIAKSTFRQGNAKKLQSKIMNKKIGEENYELIKVAKDFKYIFSRIEHKDAQVAEAKERIPESVLSQFICAIDRSIHKVEYTDGDSMSFNIEFNDGQDLLVDYYKLSDLEWRLSYGTVDAIQFFFKLYEILEGGYNTIYIDEELSHIQSELEKVLFLSLIQNLPNDAQLFFTTHNTELLKIDLPVSCYTILSEDKEGKTVVTNVEDYIKNKNDRNSLFNYIRSNYFSTEKYYDELFDIVEGMIISEGKQGCVFS